MSNISIHLYCQHVNSNHVHCNRHTAVQVSDTDASIGTVVAASDWDIVNGEPRCPDHA